MINFARLVCINLIVFVIYSSSFAESPADFSPDQVAQDLGKILPDLTKRNTKPLQIHYANAVKFKSIIVPELFEQVREGKIEFTAAAGLQHAWRMDDNWEVIFSEKDYSISLEKGFVKKGELVRGFPFGDKRSVEQETDPNLFAKVTVKLIVF